MSATFSPTFDRFVVDVEPDLGALPEMLLRCARRVLRRRRLSAAPKSRRSTSFCSPAFGERACACASPADESKINASANGDHPIIEGWIAFPTAIADGTASGTVFLESSRQAGLRSRVIANLSVEGGGIQNWIHFRMPFSEELELEAFYGVRATLVATDALTGHKRLFGTTRAAPLYHRKAEAGIILELEDWG
jgi:hypothetical protein